MIKTAISSVRAHKLRLVLTAAAIIMGVAFIAGTYMFSDTINARFDTVITDAYGGTDVTVQPDSADFAVAGGSLEPGLLDLVRSTDGVEQAVPSVSGSAQIIAPDGTPIGGQGPPTLGFSWVEVPALNFLQIKDGNGRAPEGPGELAIDAATAATNSFEVGDNVDVLTAAGIESFELVGLVSFGTEDNLAGATLSIFSLAEAQRLFGMGDRYSQIDVMAADGVTPADLTATLSEQLPAGVKAITGEQQAEQQLTSVTSGLGFVTKALLAFAGVAVFVGSFIISNTFRIIVAQRTKELALLRAIGASARQVTMMVLVEALLIGTVASLLGVGAGVGFAELLKLAMNSAGFNLPEGHLTLQPRTIVVAMTVGIVITLISALKPALRAAKTPPVAAIREVAPGQAPLRRRALTGLIVTAAGAASMAAGLLVNTGAALYLVAGGALVVFLGISTLAPLFARPIVSLIGRPLPGVVGQLARGNTIREPRRTAATASALMIGVALVAFVSIFAASFKASTADTIEQAFPADLAFQSSNFSMGVSPEAVDRIAALEETDVVSAILMNQARIAGNVTGLIAVDPATIESVYNAKASIPMSDLGEGILVNAGVIEEQGWIVGTELPVDYPSGGTGTLVVAGSFEDDMFSDYIISTDTYAQHFEGTSAGIVFARLVDGVTPDEGKAAAEAALDGFPNVGTRTASDQVASLEAQIDQMLALFSGLLGLAIVVAVLGIANTLALTTVERTRELGLLRAVGMGRRQVRRMVRWEAIMTSLFGAVLGIGLGVALAWAVLLSLADDGLSTISLPTLQLAIGLAVAALAGVVAAIGPARRASRMDVLKAISVD